MMKHLQRLGKSLMLPVACLPAASLLMGIGYWLDPAIMQGGDPGSLHAIASFLVKAGGALIDNMAILFAIGVGVGMSDDNDGTAGLAGLVSWLMMTTLLSPGTVAALKGIDVGLVDKAFGKTQTQFIGILAGVIGAICYNKFKNTKLPDALSFFSGKRSVAIVTAIASLFSSFVLFFIWPIIYGGLVAFGKAIMDSGAIGAGIYATFNRLLIPFGLHHALNSVFWFDIAGINDIGKYLGTVEGGIRGVTGMYQTGFFPVMMFGLPAGALAMYHTAKDKNKKIAAGVLLGGALSAFFTGVTEPLEFAFMFLAPGLYVVHALFTGISVAISVILPARCGFAFSAGFVDWILSFRNPMAVKPWMIIPMGLVVGVLYYFVFRFVINKFNLKTPGREDDIETETKVTLSNDNFTEVAAIVLEGIGGKENVTNLDNCVTRLRFEIKDYTKVNEKKIKSAGVAGIIRPSKTSVQVIIGTKVEFVANEIKKML